MMKDHLWLYRMNSLAIDPNDTTTSPETLVETSTVNSLDPELPKSSRAHDARLNSYIKCNASQWQVRIECFPQRGVRKHRIDCFEFCMSSCLLAMI